MNILILSGSPRKNGNTDLLVGSASTSSTLKTRATCSCAARRKRAGFGVRKR